MAALARLNALMPFLPDAQTLPTIRTARLALRWITADDVPALFEIFSDPVVCRYWSRPAMTTTAAASALREEIVDYFESRTLFQWGIVDASTSRLLGTCTLAALSEQHRRAELGYALARAHWGKGYVQEALRALLDFAFDTLDLHRIEADVDPRNAASIRVLERLHFRREGHLRERYHMLGEVQDAYWYGLLKAEWKAASHQSDQLER
jgi:[ribosomal protein S5]-alanine N-acetyltransferase